MWVESKDQEFPDGAQHYENYKNTQDNIYLGAVNQKTSRNKDVITVIPICLWTDDKKITIGLMFMMIQ